MIAAVTAPMVGASPASATPPPKAATDIPETPYERYELDNGMEVIVHVDRRVPLVAVDLWYHVGSGDERPGRSGFAHLFEHMMFQGAKHIGEDVHFDVLRRIGAGTVNGTTNRDRTNYFEVVPSHHLDTALWLESDRMGYLLDLLNERSLANQIDVVRNERRQRYDNVAFGKERFAVAAGLYPEKHPYRYLTIGRHEDLEAASLRDVRDFFVKWYVPSNATLVLAGDIDPKTVKATVEKWFGGFPELPQPKHDKQVPPPLTETVVTELEDPLARVTRLHLAWHSPAKLGPGDAELTIAGRALGSRGWGRLHRRLVLEKQLAQRVSVYQSGAGFSGEFHVVVDIKPGHSVSEVRPIIDEELQRLQREPIEQRIVDRIVNRIESDFVWGMESLLTRAERLQYFNHFAGDPGYVPKYVETYRTRTPADVQKVAAEVLSKPHVEVVTKPGSKAK
jgi:predicted Zn-dependent peptidase